MFRCICESPITIEETVTVKIRPFRYGNMAVGFDELIKRINIVKIRPFRYGNKDDWCKYAMMIISG